MSTWSELRGVLANLHADPRRPLLVSPNLNSDDHQPPFRLCRQAWAEGIASDLHDPFGREVEIRVGGLDYPERHRRPRWGLEPPSPPEYPLLPAEQLTVSLDRPVVVASGHDTRSSVRVHNHQDRAEEVATNGHVLTLDHGTYRTSPLPLTITS